VFVIWHHGWLPRHLLWKQWKQFWGTNLFQKNGIGPKKTCVVALGSTTLHVSPRGEKTFNKGAMVAGILCFQEIIF